MRNTNNYCFVPDVNSIARDLTTKSQLQIVTDRFLHLDFKCKIKIIFNNIPYLIKIVSKDFAAGIKLLCELEILKKKCKIYVFHHQMVDMSICLKNKNVLTYFFNLSKKYNFTPAIKTNNVSYLINFLSEFNEIPENLTIFIDKKSYEDLGLSVFNHQSNLTFVTDHND